MVEGQPGAGFCEDAAQDRVGILENFHGGDTQGHDPGGEKPGVASRITLGAVAPVVGFAIDFDRQACVAAEEIEAVRAGWMLPTEFDAGILTTQRLPENDFRKRHLATKSAGIADGAPSSLRCDVPEHGAGPSTMLRMVPLPETSSGRI